MGPRIFITEKVGFVYHGDQNRQGELSLDKPYSDQTAEEIDAEVKRIIDDAYQATRETILTHREQGEAIAQALIKYETLSADEIHALIRGEKLDRPTVTDLLAEEKKRDQASVSAPPIPSELRPDTDLGEGTLPQPS